MTIEAAPALDQCYTEKNRCLNNPLGLPAKINFPLRVQNPPSCPNRRPVASSICDRGLILALIGRDIPGQSPHQRVAGAGTSNSKPAPTATQDRPCFREELSPKAKQNLPLGHSLLQVAAVNALLN